MFVYMYVYMYLSIYLSIYLGLANDPSSSFVTRQTRPFCRTEMFPSCDFNSDATRGKKEKKTKPSIITGKPLRPRGSFQAFL